MRPDWGPNVQPDWESSPTFGSVEPCSSHLSRSSHLSHQPGLGLHFIMILKGVMWPGELPSLLSFHEHGVFDYWFGFFKGYWFIQNCHLFVSPFDYLIFYKTIHSSRFQIDWHKVVPGLLLWPRTSLLPVIKLSSQLSESSSPFLLHLSVWLSLWFANPRCVSFVSSTSGHRSSFPAGLGWTVPHWLLSGLLL